MIVAAYVNRPNPLKRLALHRHPNVMILASVVAKKLMVFDYTVTQAHDARGIRCRFYLLNLSFRSSIWPRPLSTSTDSVD